MNEIKVEGWGVILRALSAAVLGFQVFCPVFFFFFSP